MVRSLLWKEWREHRWKMLAVFAVFAGIGLGCQWLVKWRPFEVVQLATFEGALLVPAFVALGTLLEERSRRTAEMLRAVPVRPERIFMIKALWGLATAIVPMVLAQLLNWHAWFPAAAQQAPGVVPEFRELAFAAAIAAGIYAWTIALGARQTRESVLAAIAGASVYGHVLLLNLLLWGSINPWAILSFGGDLTYLGERWAASSTVALLLEAALTAAGLAIACRRYAAGPTVSRRTGPLLAGIAVPPSVRWPVLWKSWAEMRGLAIRYLVVATGLALVVLAAANLQWLNSGLYHWNLEEEWVQKLLRWLALDSSFGFDYLLQFAMVFVAVIIGTQVGAGDFQRGLERFWMSRPIGARTYFWKRYGVAALVVMACAALPYLLMTVAWMGVMFANADWQSLPWSHRPGAGGPLEFYHLRMFQASSFEAEWVYRQMLVLLPRVATVFGLAVILAAFFRKRVLAMLLTIGAGFLHILVLETIAADLFRQLRDPTGFGGHPAAISLSMAAAILLALGVVGQAAFTGDWKERIEAWFREKLSARPFSAEVVR